MKQLQWVNIVKGITITVVVILHINYSAYNEQFYFQIKNIIGDAWDMPVFFLIGGFFISYEKIKNGRKFLKKKFTSIYLKLLYYYAIFLCLHNIFICTGLLSTSVEYGGKQMVSFTITTFLQKLLLSMFFMGREPYLSPLWFIYVMSMAFIVLTILAVITDRLTSGDTRRWHIVMTAVLATLCTLSLFCTNQLDINIPRCNNVFSAAWLIFLGYMLRNTFSMTFRNSYAAALSLLALVATCFLSEHMALITNSYSNILQLSVCGLSALYLLSYIAQHIENTIVGKCIAAIGRQSYHIMALHLLAINLFAALLNAIFSTKYPIDVLGNNADTLLEMLLFTVVGVALPIAFMLLVPLLNRKIKKLR